MDRTREFFAVVKLFGGQPPPESQGPPPPPTDFAVAASTVGLGFGGTLRLVQRLQKLVTRKGLHNDPTAEIDDVTAVFKKDLAELKREIDALQRYADAQTGRNTQRQKHCHCVVEGFRSRAGDHTKLFQEALQVRTTILKEQSERRKQFTHSSGGPSLKFDSPLFMPPPLPPGSSSSSAPSSRDGPGSRSGSRPGSQAPTPPTSSGDGRNNRASSLSAAPQPTANGVGGPGGVPPSVPAPPPPPPNGVTPPQQNPYSLQSQGGADAGAGLRRRYAAPPVGGQAMMMMQHQHQNATTRLEDARHIEKTIGELGQMFSKMASLVHAQAEVVNRIDDDVEVALADVEKGHQDMQEFYRIVSGNRSVIIKVFLILIAFILVFGRYF